MYEFKKYYTGLFVLFSFTSLKPSNSTIGSVNYLCVISPSTSVLLEGLISIHNSIDTYILKIVLYLI